MLLSFGLGAFTATKTLQMGLKYQMEMKEGVKPEHILQKNYKDWDTTTYTAEKLRTV